MAKRHKDALMIQEGAVNLIGIAHSLIDACREVLDEGGGTPGMYQDPAVRLILHQMAFLCNIRNVDDSDVYARLTAACLLKVEEVKNESADA